MLFKLVNEVCSRIEDLDTEIEAPQMFDQINEARPEILQNMRQAGDPGVDQEATLRLVTLALATGVLVQIKETPAIAGLFVQKVKDNRAPAALRCALASVLAYLVQPHDLVPDDLPGGYGFIDDRAILQAGLIEYLKLYPVHGLAVDTEASRLNLFASILPLAIVPTVQLAVRGISTVFQILNALPPQTAELTLQQIIANPLQAAAPAAAPGFAPSAIPQVGGGHWSNGGYFEDGNVVIPGGPSLIDGQLFIPQ